VDVVLLSHGDLQHSGLYAYAYSRWALKAPAYTSLPVQALARVAVTEDVEGIRDEQDVDFAPSDEGTETKSPDMENDGGSMDVDAAPPSLPAANGKYIATLQEVHEAFDSLNVLRYSQPCHLAGKVSAFILSPESDRQSL
jgi:cleavage and polyadenylation specificity factor subunit 2